MVLQQQESERQEPERLLSKEQETRPQLPTEILQKQEGTVERILQVVMPRTRNGTSKDFAKKRYQTEIGQP